MFGTKEGLPIRALILHGWMPSWLKTRYYRAKGYRIGDRVKLGLGSVVIGNDVDIGAETRVGMLSVIRGRRIRIGPRVRIGFSTLIDTYDIAVGEGTRINNQVVVGGMQSPTSRFHMGRNGILMEWSFVNTTHPVDIGDDVGIGGHCLFFTHGMWPNTFEGYPASFAPIRIEDRAWLAWRVSVLPGVSIGAGSIVSSDACVNKDIPPMALAAGVPAKALRSDGAFLRPHDAEANAERLTALVDQFGDWLSFHGANVQRPTRGALGATGKDGRFYEMRIRLDARDPLIGSENCLVSLLALNEAERDGLERAGKSWIDIALRERSRRDDAWTDEIEEFLRRAGLRILKYGRWRDAPSPAPGQSAPTAQAAHPAAISAASDGAPQA